MILFQSSLPRIITSCNCFNKASVSSLSPTILVRFSKLFNTTSTASTCTCTPKPSSSRRCIGDDDIHQASSKDFSVLQPEIPWDNGNIWSTFAFYMFSLHIPLSFGGLSVVAHVMHQDVLDPQTEAISLLGIQIFELIGAFCLLQYTAEPQFELLSFFNAKKPPHERNTWFASAVGFAFLVLLVFLTSLVADRLIGSKTVNNPVLKEILQNGCIARAACILVYCFLTPLLEELVYRAFLLTSFVSTLKWQQAIVLSSAIFSAAHFSGENFMQLFIIGCVLGCCYCWTGDLRSSTLVHSLYNAMILLITSVS